MDNRHNTFPNEILVGNHYLNTHMPSNNNIRTSELSQDWYKDDNNLLLYYPQTHLIKFTYFLGSTTELLKKNSSHALIRIGMNCGDLYINVIDTNNNYPL